MGAENPPPIAIITRLTLTPNIAIIPKARRILHFGYTVQMENKYQVFNFTVGVNRGMPRTFF